MRQHAAGDADNVGDRDFPHVFGEVLGASPVAVKQLRLGERLCKIERALNGPHVAADNVAFGPFELDWIRGTLGYAVEDPEYPPGNIAVGARATVRLCALR